jgi:PAS domain S-box-containing protein
MANRAPLDDDRPEQEARLRQFLAWLILVVFGFELLLLAAFIRLARPVLAAAGIVLFGFGLLLLFVYARLRLERLETTATQVCVSLLVTIALIKLAEPVSPATLAVAPLLAVLIALPYVRPRRLRQLMAAACLTALVIELLNELAAPVADLPFWVSVAFRAGSFALVVALLLLLLWQFYSRLTDLMARFHGANAALRESEERYRTVSEMTSDAIYSYRATPDGDFALEWATDTLTRLTGYTPDELSPPGAWRATMAGLPEALELLRARLTDHETDVTEIPFRTKSGEIRWVRNYSRIQRDSEHHRIVRILSAAQDITDRKRAEEALQRRFDQLQAIYHMTDTINRAGAIEAIYGAALDGLRHALKADRAAIQLFDDDGVVRFKAWYGLSDAYRAAATGQSPWPRDAKDPAPILVPDVEVESSWQALVPAIRGEGIRSLAFIPLVHQGVLLGKFVIYYDQAHQFTAEEVQLAQTIAGQIVFALERNRSEEERRALERKLLETQKLESLAVLAGGIAHDFNNLLAIILGNVDLARMELPPDSPAQELLAPIAGAIQRATGLTQQMLAYSGKGHFLLELIDLNALLLEMHEPIRTALGEQVTAIYQLAPDLPPIEADPSQIRQIVLNLAINAAEAIGRSAGTVTIGTGVRSIDRAFLAEAYLAPERVASRYIALDVVDSGSGMDEATLARIFEPFFTTKFMGRGLGLSAVLGIVRGHHGAIRVRSVPRQGARFTILFPAADTGRNIEIGGPGDVIDVDLPDFPPTGLLAAERSLIGRRPMLRGVLLIVDDEEAIRIMAARVLQMSGFAVMAAVDGQSALAIFRAYADAIVCVLLDLIMPGPSGDVVFHDIRRIKPDACVILMSGYDEREAASRFAEQRPNGFLQKPFAPEQLRDMLRQILGDV